MNVRKNASLTPAGQDLLAQRVDSVWTVRKVAPAAGISPRTATKWMSHGGLIGDPSRAAMLVMSLYPGKAQSTSS